MQQTVNVTLSDGRKLSCLLVGNPDHKPVIFFHSFGLSKNSIHPDDSILNDAGVFLLSIDRPGTGASDYTKPRSVYDFIDNVREVADQLGLKTFGVMGWSGGSVYAQAAALHMPERVVSVHLLGSAVPCNTPQSAKMLTRQLRWLCVMTKHFPWLMRWRSYNKARSVQENPEAVFQTFVNKLAYPSQTVALQPHLKPLLIKARNEGYANNGLGLYYDAVAVSNTPGLPLEDIRVPVYIWHGAKDNVWSPAVSQYLHSRIKSSRYFEVDDAGHLIYLKEWKRIVATMSTALSVAMMNLPYDDVDLSSLPL